MKEEVFIGLQIKYINEKRTRAIKTDTKIINPSLDVISFSNPYFFILKITYVLKKISTTGTVKISKKQINRLELSNPKGSKKIKEKLLTKKV